MKNKHKVLLIDFNNLLWRGLAVHRHLSYRGTPTGGLYGFIRMMCNLVNRYECTRVVVCHDSKPYHRSIVYPAYKGDRPARGDDGMLRVKGISEGQVRGFLASLGILEANEPGWEADDIIGAYCRQRFRRFERIFIGSNDSDLYQLFAVAQNVYLCTQGGLYGIVDFKKEFPGLQPHQWPRVLALKGSHNGVPGIKGVGVVNAVKMVVKGIGNDELKEKHGCSIDELRVRAELSTYPYAGVEPPPKTPVPEAIEYKPKAITEHLDHYAIRMTDDFRKAFARLASE